MLSAGDRRAFSISLKAEIAETETEPRLLGLPHGAPSPRDGPVSRLKVLRNAVVPHVAEFLGRMIFEIDRPNYPSQG